MIPDHYFSVICCPKCKADVIQKSPNTLTCTTCNSEYDIIEGIPVLLDEVKDNTTILVKKFYDQMWKRDEHGRLRAVVAHVDLSDLGQRYMWANEDRFLHIFSKYNGKFFLDAASGACPREDFGSNFAYHVCLDLSLDGLFECRKLLGPRAICVLGSLLEMPIKTSTCDGIIASHCIYHIDKNLQGAALSELSRVLSNDGTLLILYARQNEFQRFVSWQLEKFKRRLSTPDSKKASSDDSSNGLKLYYYTYPVDSMLNMISDKFPEDNIFVRPLRLFNKGITEFLFGIKVLGRCIFIALTFSERTLLSRWGVQFCSYVCYIVKRFS